MPPKSRRRKSSSIAPDTIDEIRRKIRDQEEKIIGDFRSLDNCNNLFNKWRYKKRQDAEARRGFKAWQARKDLKTKLNKRIREEERERQLSTCGKYSLSPALDKLRVSDNDNEDGNDEMVELSNNDNVSNNAMIRQVANGISSQSNYLETALGDRDSGMEAPGEHHYQNNDNAAVAVELSPTMENPRVERGSVDDCLHISSRSAEEKEGEEDIFVCTLCYSNYSARCVDRRYPFLTSDPRDPLEIMIMEECDNTFRIPSQYCFFNIEELKHHTEMHHLDPLLNESNPNLLESLYDDDDKVRTITMTTTQNSLHMIQLSAIPIACLGGNGVGTCSYMNIF